MLMGIIGVQAQSTDYTSRLEYTSDSFDDVRTELSNLIMRAQKLLAYRMNSEANQTLTDAVATALTALSEYTGSEFSAAAAALESAYDAASSSQAVFGRLAAAIAAANEEVEENSSAETMDYVNAIYSAQAVYDSASTTDAQAEAAITALAEASFAFKILNGIVTGIEAVELSDELQQDMNIGEIYDLSGRRITSPNKLKHGIYIINGQKFIK